jgi:DNA-binding winged helix-turn-helix (wHTH) protein
MNRCTARLMHRLALTSQKMADTKHTSITPPQTANPQRVSPDGTPGIISFGPYRLIAALRRLERAGGAVPLGDREFDLLCTLTARAGQIVSNRELMASIGGKSAVGKRRLRVHINALRTALSQDGVENQYIRKVTRRGYVFTAPISLNTAGGGEGNCPLWDGHIIDATFPPV